MRGTGWQGPFMTTIRTAGHVHGRLLLAFLVVALALFAPGFGASWLLATASDTSGAGVTMLVEASLPARPDVLACLHKLAINSVPDSVTPASVVVEISAQQRSALEACGVLIGSVRPLVLLEARSPTMLALASAYAENGDKMPFSTFSVQSVVTIGGAPPAATVVSADLYYKLVIKPGVPWNGVDAALQSSNKPSYDWICGRHHPTTTCFVEWSAANKDWLNGTLVNGTYSLTIDTPSDLTAGSYLDFWSLRLYYNEPTPTPTPKVGDVRIVLPLVLLRVD
jgi:hypothetical protein